MILVDTSVWIDHFRKPDTELQKIVGNGSIYVHPFVTGELAAGSLQAQHRMILLLQSLPQLSPVGEETFYTFLDQHGVNGKGLGFVDIHLLAAAWHAKDTRLWTTDRRLGEQAARLGIEYSP